MERERDYVSIYIEYSVKNIIPDQLLFHVTIPSTALNYKYKNMENNTKQKKEMQFYFLMN